MDEDGYTKIVDRKKDMILVSGFNVYPERDRGRDREPSRRAGMRRHRRAGREIRRGGQSCSSSRRTRPSPRRTCIKYCGTQLTGYKVPKQIEFRTDLPKTNVGKILRRELRDEKKAAA